MGIIQEKEEGSQESSGGGKGRGCQLAIRGTGNGGGRRRYIYRRFNAIVSQLKISLF